MQIKQTGKRECERKLAIPSPQAPELIQCCTSQPIHGSEGSRQKGHVKSLSYSRTGQIWSDSHGSCDIPKYGDFTDLSHTLAPVIFFSSSVKHFI
jgi:hypothetical protein